MRLEPLLTFVPKSGQTLGGKYRIVRLIGEGGMGAVFEAEHVVTHKRVALKWLHPEAALDRQAQERLVREAQASARVCHPNVVDVYDVDREGESVFLVMELLEGETLTALLKRHELRMHELVALLIRAMRGVAAAHQEGVIHRDIKPDNIFLAREKDTQEPVPKVLDFGVSKLDPRGQEQLSLTRTGSTVGTPLYMSYEQLSGLRDLDARVDIYAFGVILYEALTGHPPFDASSYSELVVKVATQLPVPPKQLRADIPTALAALVTRAMAKDRNERFADLGALIRELEPFSTERGFRAEMTLSNVSVPTLATAAEALRPLAAPTVPMTAMQASAPAVETPAPLPAPASASLAQQKSKRPPSHMKLALAAALLGCLISVWLAHESGYFERGTRAAGAPEPEPVGAEPTSTHPPASPPAEPTRDEGVVPITELLPLAPGRDREASSEWVVEAPSSPPPSLDPTAREPQVGEPSAARTRAEQRTKAGASGAAPAREKTSPRRVTPPGAVPARAEPSHVPDAGAAPRYRVNQLPRGDEF